MLSAKKSRRLMQTKLIDKPHVINHIELVTKKALEIGRRLRKKGYGVDSELLEIGGYLHDIGRSVTHKVGHGVQSGRIVRELGFPESVVRLVERHIGAGITSEEAVRLGLPRKDYIPETLEEKILSYADKFLESKLVFKTVNGEEIVERKDIEYESIEPTLKRFRELFGLNNPIVLRLEKLRDEMKSLLE